MSMPLLEGLKLSKHYQVKANPFAPAQTAKAVDGITLTLTAGETLGLAGESGCGKSTVAKLLMGLTPVTAGQVLFCGEDLATLTAAGMHNFRKAVQMIFQDPFASLNPRMRIGDIIGEPLLIHKGKNSLPVRESVISLMNSVGLPAEHMDRYPHEFSGGQRQRIGIARALAVSPKVIIADEPVSALDISIQAQIINLLQDLQRDLNLAYLVISHDLAVLRHISSRVAVMYLGKIVEEGDTETLYAAPLHPYTDALLAAIPKISTSRGGGKSPLKGDIPSPLSPPSGCHFHPRCPFAREICRLEVPVLEEKESRHKAACHFSLELFR